MLLARRKPGGVNGRRWEFPGGKVDPGESPRQSLRREFGEELGVDVAVGARLATGTFSHRGQEFFLEAFRIELGPAEFRFHEHEEAGWFTLAEAARLDLVPSDRDILPEVSRSLGADSG